MLTIQSLELLADEPMPMRKIENPAADHLMGLGHVNCDLSGSERRRREGQKKRVDGHFQRRG